MKKLFYISACVLIISSSCNGFLDVKPDKALAVPKHGSDLQALLDNFTVINQLYSIGLGEIGSDNCYVNEADWRSIYYPEQRDLYIWERTPVVLNYWASPYGKILTTNTVIDLIDDVSHSSEVERNVTLGKALFLRGVLFYDLSQVFAPPFDEENADERLGIVLRLSPDINEVSRRSTIGEMYAQILSDLKYAAHLLPAGKPLLPTKPSKAAAYGALSRVYMAMRDYHNAGLYADSCLQIHHEMMDFNKFVDQKTYPFDRFNEEVIFYSEMRASEYLGESRGRIPNYIYGLYSELDQRRRLFFSPSNLAGQYLFVGDYSQNSGAVKFCGITTPEILLNYAECLAREGRGDEIKIRMNEFLMCRYEVVPDIVFSMDNNSLLAFILSERRKELLYRGVRWTDVRRLSYDPDHRVEIVRDFQDDQYVLTPARQQTFYYSLPQEVLDRGGIQ